MEQLKVIRTLSELTELKEYLRDKDFIAYDTETTGLDRESQIIGLSVSADPEIGYYVVFSEWDSIGGVLRDLETKAGAQSFVDSLVGKSLIMHNAVFDCMITKSNYDVELMDSVHTDTMILAHLLDENRPCGLKELAVAIYGDDSKREQEEMKESIVKNGGSASKVNYELYKADSEVIARYGAKDALLTLKLFYHLIPSLYEQGLEDFFYKDESMPLLRGPTYELNTTGLKVDPVKLGELRRQLEADCAEAMAYIEAEVTPLVKDKYPGDKKTNKFNINSTEQLAWLLYIKLGNPFHVLTDAGKEVCKALNLKMPYSYAAQREFIQIIEQNHGRVWAEAKINPKTKKMVKAKTVGEVWKYLAAGKESLSKLAPKYKWLQTYLKYKKDDKILNTYVLGIQERAKYGVIRPSFLQHGTTSGRYSSRNPNFQNLPRDDKRVKACIVARPGKVFVGADYSQLEPRVFASMSQDPRLMKCFEDGDDFYSVIGTETFDKYDCTLKKDDANSFAKKYPRLRDIIKIVCLSSTYGTTAFKMAPTIGKTVEEAQEVINNYFEKFPAVHKFMLNCHKEAKERGYVTNLYGRPRRMPEALTIKKIYGNTSHGDLPYYVRNILNLAVNHQVQSTGASIMNRAAIEFSKRIKGLVGTKIVLQVHDELVAECPSELGEHVAALLKSSMENAARLPGVALKADPKIANNLADLK